MVGSQHVLHARKTKTINVNDKPLDEKLIQRISKFATTEISNKFKTSATFVNTDGRLAAYPRFEESEVKYGRVLGRGQFGVVHEISRLVLQDTLEVRGKNNSAKICTSTAHSVSEGREFLRDNCVRNGRVSRYVVKKVSMESLVDPEMFLQATMDLAFEAHVLSALSHTNIVNLRALSSDRICTPKFFLVLDRLFDTLESTIFKWKTKKLRYQGLSGVLFDFGGRKKHLLWDKRLVVGFGIADAIAYLHDRSIIHRDLKAENIGFDIRGDVKIFDFGLAKELKAEDKVREDLYNLTGKTGSLRYMAPEVFFKKPYNEKVDIYSFSMILWSIFALEKPFAKYNTLAMFKHNVFGRGHRPMIQHKWPEAIRMLLSKGLATNAAERFNAADAVSVFNKELEQHRARDGRGAGELSQAHKRRRSTFLQYLDHSESSRNKRQSSYYTAHSSFKEEKEVLFPLHSLNLITRDS